MCKRIFIFFPQFNFLFLKKEKKVDYYFSNLDFEEDYIAEQKCNRPVGYFNSYLQN